MQIQQLFFRSQRQFSPCNLQRIVRPRRRLVLQNHPYSKSLTLFSPLIGDYFGLFSTSELCHLCPHSTEGCSRQLERRPEIFYWSVAALGLLRGEFGSEPVGRWTLRTTRGR